MAYARCPAIQLGWKFLIRVKDGNSGIVSALPLPKTEAFDCAFQLSLTRSRTNELKKRMKEDPSLKYIKIYCIQLSV